ncbi:hypothetical protein SprV_0200975000 [Sparganum proliferum]
MEDEFRLTRARLRNILAQGPLSSTSTTLTACSGDAQRVFLPDRELAQAYSAFILHQIQCFIYRLPTFIPVRDQT